jgi:methyl-accepting chemotaxis protein
MHGLFEMHFFAFIGATLLIAYQDWKVFIPLALLVVVHHALFAYLQYSGLSDVYFTQLQYMDLQTFIFHAALAVVIVGICAFWAYDFAQRTSKQNSITENLEEQIGHMEHGIAFATEISRGNLKAQYQNHTEDDQLSRALLEMQKSLQEAAAREEQERFTNRGLATLNDILRTHQHDTQKLADLVVKEMVTYLGMNQGGLFLVEGEEDEKYLQLAACFAYNRKKYQQRRIEIGEGLVGQAYLEKDISYLTDLPQGYTYITSGLGEATANCLLIVPIMNNDTVVGVMELASLQIIDPDRIGFVRRAAELIASSIQSAQVSKHTKQLVEDLQQQTEHMQAQEEEMRQNMEEISATHEEMERNSRRYQQMLEERDAEITRLKAKQRQEEFAY